MPSDRGGVEGSDALYSVSPKLLAAELAAPSPRRPLQRVEQDLGRINVAAEAPGSDGRSNQRTGAAQALRRGCYSRGVERQLELVVASVQRLVHVVRRAQLEEGEQDVGAAVLGRAE